MPHMTSVFRRATTLGALLLVVSAVSCKSEAKEGAPGSAAPGNSADGAAETAQPSALKKYVTEPKAAAQNAAAAVEAQQKSAEEALYEGEDSADEGDELEEVED